MPGEEAGYSAVPGGALYPDGEDAQAALLATLQQWFASADARRGDYYDRWMRHHRLYRSYVELDKTDWRSKVFMPYSFSIIETVAPRLLSEVPKFVVMPMSPDDVESALAMESLMDRSTSATDLYLELTKAVKSALKYGTGILKNFHRRDIYRAQRAQPIFEPVTLMMPTPQLGMDGQPAMSLDGNMMFSDREVTIDNRQVGTQMVPYEYVGYDGPASVFVDLFNFWVAPEATDMEDARYVIHRTYKEMGEVLRLVNEGVYQLPPSMTPEDVTDVDDEPLSRRLQAIGIGGSSADTTRKPVELLEFWTKDGRVATMANRKAVLRHDQNPFNHGMKPFSRFVDYLQEGEFYGVGEIEAIEGLQDVQNALVNSRVDNVKLNVHSMFAINKEAVKDPRHLQVRPGGVVEIQGDFPVSEAFQRIDFGDVTASAFAEVAEMERQIERVTGVTAYQTGTDSPSLNDTATGVALISEQGNTKFAMKLRLIELTGLRPLARQWGSIIQQFTTEEQMVRVLGVDGQWVFQAISPESIQGALDFDIQVSSTTQTETIRRQQDIMLVQLLAQVWPQAIPSLVRDLLRDFGRKNVTEYMVGGMMPGMQPMLPPGAPPGPPSAGPGAPGAGIPQQLQPEGQAQVG